jgi:hypothetical protein
MQQVIYLRVNQEQGINQVLNHVFTFNAGIVLSLYPLPEWLKGVKCDCGKEANFLLKDFSYICKSCVISNFPKNKLTSKQDIFTPITEKTIKGIKFEWSVNREKWYYIWGRKIVTENMKALLPKLKDMILKNKEIELEGDYDINTKIMTIY